MTDQLAIVLTDLFISALITWYLAYAITSTHGPFQIFDRARKVTTLGGLLECPVCAAPWIAAIVMLYKTGRFEIGQVLAVAGLAMLLHGFSNWRFNT